MVLKELTLDEKIDLVHGEGMPGWGKPCAERVSGKWRGGICARVPTAGNSHDSDE